MVDLSQDELSQVQNEANQILVQLESVENQGWVKKSDLVKSYIEKNRILRDAGLIEINGPFSTYIRAKLSERNITVSQNNRFTDLFEPDEKDPRGQDYDLDDMSKNISSGLTTDEIFKEKKKPIVQKDTAYTQFLTKEEEAIKEALALNQLLRARYNESTEYQGIMDKNFNEDMVVDLVNAMALIRVSLDNVDDRVKLSDSQKCNLQLLINIGETKAEAAKQVGICAKYASIGVERSEDVDRYWTFLNKCLACGADEKQHRDEIIKRYELGLDLGIKTPLKGY